MGGFIFAASTAEEYIYNSYHPGYMMRQYQTFAAEKATYLATFSLLDVANGERLPSPLPWRLPSPPPTLSEVIQYMQENDIDESEWDNDHHLI